MRTTLAAPAAWRECEMTARLSPQRMALAGVGVLALFIAIGGAFLTHRDSGATPVRPECNGSASLCASRLDEVALATTHNSMNDAEDGFLYPSQEQGIEAQLESGVRGFLIDAFLGSPRMAGD